MVWIYLLTSTPGMIFAETVVQYLGRIWQQFLTTNRNLESTPKCNIALGLNVGVGLGPQSE